MKGVFVLFAFTRATAVEFAQSAAPSFVPGTAADEGAIRAILEREETGDRSQLPNDLDWENAFGVRYTERGGRADCYGQEGEVRPVNCCALLAPSACVICGKDTAILRHIARNAGVMV